MALVWRGAPVGYLPSFCRSKCLCPLSHQGTPHHLRASVV
ncbi:hypothetical protein CGRA01v4_03282 [Colletotrichum graminicola]|nr:hypothetical protein CGRA01v4_03282 [Colletotrichum graminicola]